MTRFVAKLAFSSLLVLFCPLAFAETPTVTFDEVLDTITRQNPQIKALQAQMDIGDARILTASKRPNPRAISDSGIAEDTYRVGIEQTVELADKRKKRVAVAQAQKSVISREVATALLDLRTRARKVYTQLYVTQERQKAYENIVNISQRLKEVAQKRESYGDIAKLDVLQAEMAAEMARNDFLTQTSELQTLRQELNTLLYDQPLPPNAQLATPALMPNLQNLEPETLLAQALANRPEKQRLEAMQTVSLRQLDLAKANRVPSLSLTMGPDVVTAGSGQLWSSYIIAGVEIPLFNRQQGAIAEALANQRMAQFESQLVARQIQLDVQNALLAFQTQRSRLGRFNDVLLPTADKILKMSQSSFAEGKTSIIVSITAQQNYIQVLLSALKTLQDLQNAISDLERAVGGPSS